MKNVISKKKYVLMVFIMLLTFSCSTEDGKDGADGAQGAQGNAGQDGTNGQDGNANVQRFIFDISLLNESFRSQNIPEITQDVFDNDVIIGYVFRNGFLYPLPAIRVNNQFNIQTLIEPEIYHIFFRTLDNSSPYNIVPGQLEELIVVIIESNSTTGRSAGKSGKESILDNLKAAGVDINNYYEVMDYYGLEY